jgi:dynein intermediate chain 2
MEIVHVYTKKRSEFGRQPLFTDRLAELNVEIAPDDSLRQDFIDKNPVDMAIQYAPDVSEHEANTERFESESRGMNHTEGGWPKDINPAEVEQTIRFRKKVEKDENYINVVQRLGDKMELYLRQNNAIDIYENYFSGKTFTSIDSDPPSAKTISIFRDPEGLKRTVSHISWYPDGAHRLAAAYCSLEFQNSSHGMSLDSYIWELENPNKPEQVLKPASPLLCLEYNPKDPHLLVGGCYNGQLALFDTRKGSQSLEVTPIEISHKEPVHKIIFPSSKTGSDVFSTSTDGQVLWWDIRKLVEPVEALPLVFPGYKPDFTLGGIVVEYESTMPTKFMVGTEQGVILCCNRKAKTPQEKITNAFTGHHGPIYALQRNPFYPKHFLSIGDWTARLWSEDAKESPIMWTKYDESPLTDGCWSPTRPAVFFTSSTSGTMHVWDLVFKQSSPTLTVQVSDESLHSVRCHGGGKMVACGSRSGDLSLLELSDSLSVIQPNEKPNITAVSKQQQQQQQQQQHLV